MFFYYGLKNISKDEAWISSEWQEMDLGHSLNGSMEGFELLTNGGDVCLLDIVDSSFSFIPFGSLGEAPTEATFYDRSSKLHMYSIATIQVILHILLQCTWFSLYMHNMSKSSKKKRRF